MSVFYERFERHDHATGLKAHATHYCPGCGHGLVHRYLAEAIEALGIQDRTVAVSPVGCAVFLHYYLDVGNTQAAHGRAPAVALGHKLANPEAVVVCYQGDGDLASIGLAEIMQAAQLGIPLSVIFVNNAIYGMTGGQLAPTTLPGQKTTTSPLGRSRHEGAPLRMAEVIATLEAPVHVERVALFDSKQRAKARQAIRRSLQLQLQGIGFSFVEVLAECPTHLGLSPAEAEAWVKAQMLPVFPLGVKKDVHPDPWPAWPVPCFDPTTVLGAIGALAEAPPTFCQGFPSTPFGSDLGLKLAGAGGDGAQTAALLLTRAAIQEGFDATHISSYGPESRGGTSYADVRMADQEVLSPAVPHPHLLVAFNGPSLAKFGPEVLPGGVVVYDSSTIASVPSLDPSIRVVGVPLSDLARGLGQVAVKNLVALGALQGAVPLFPHDTLLATLRQVLGVKKAAMLPVNQDAYRLGVEAVAGASSVPRA